MSGATVQTSLRRRLLLTLVLVSLGYWSVIAVLTVRDSIEKVDELFDVHLAQTALALLHVTDPDEGEVATIPERAVGAVSMAEIFDPLPDFPQRPASSRVGSGVATGTRIAVAGASSMRAMHVEYEKHLRYQVWNNSTLLLRSANAPDVALSAQDGYSQSTDEQGHLWRHYGMRDRHGDFRILVSEDHELRNQLVRGIALHTVSPLALGLPVLVILLWASIGKGLRPLRVLTRSIETQGPENLTPLNVNSTPSEVRPIVQALNRLFGRVSHTLESERRFTANAAHELRTPLAAIQAHLHAARTSNDAQARDQALDQLQRGVERATRLVGQLLALARLDPEQALPDVRPVDLATLARAVCADTAPLALRRKQTLSLDAADDLPSWPGNEDLLGMLLTNLLDNAIRYTPEGGQIEVTLRAGESGVTLSVLDDGPGIPADQRARVFERFFRLDPQGATGTGLGLAICRRIAELHHGQIELGAGLARRGVSVSLRLGHTLETDQRSTGMRPQGAVARRPKASARIE